MLSALLLAGFAAAPPADGAEGDPLEVLLLGNSYIGFFDLSEQLNNLASAAGISANFVQFALSSATLGAPQEFDVPHDENPASLQAIASNDWDYVILQEQSCIPVLPLAKEAYMRTGASTLDAAIKANDPTTKTLMLLTWANEDGESCCYSGPTCCYVEECSPDFGSFAAMQDALTASYADVACGLGAGVVPVGEAWRAALAAGPPATLFDPDGAHPAGGGQYLSACTVFAAVTGQSPVGIPYSGPVSAAQAAFFQQVAHATVLGPNAWSLECTGPGVYCTGKPSSASCVAYIGSTDIQVNPVSGALDYSVTATNVQGAKNGLIVASASGAAALPFNGGVLCVQPPTRRGPILPSLGTFGQCDGSYSQLVNDGLMLPFGLDAGAGNTAWYQFWYRDPQNGPGQLGTALSNAIAVEFL